jgi:hypothetical protein
MLQNKTIIDVIEGKKYQLFTGFLIDYYSKFNVLYNGLNFLKKKFVTRKLWFF